MTLFSISPLQPHRDTEKQNGMFGTLVLQLPSDYEGGLLRVCHRGEEKTFDFSGLEGVTRFHYAAFYADCVHELCKVTRGYRLCLVYNLVYSGDSCTCPVPIDNREIIAKVVTDTREWEQDKNGLPLLAYVLSHQYCEASLSFQLLKGADRAKAEVLIEAEKQNNFCLFLGVVTLHQYCSVFDDHGCRCIEGIEGECLTVDKFVSPTGRTLKRIELYTRKGIVSCRKCI